jgi:hypothetical protein
MTKIVLFVFALAATALARPGEWLFFGGSV